MILAFQVGEDIHLKTASAISGINPAKFSKDEIKVFRKKAKPVNFGFLYGMWWKTFQQYAKQNYGAEFTDEEAEDSRNKFFETYTGLRKWHKRQKMLVEKLGYVRYLDGTIRRIPDIYSTEESVRKEAEKQAINSPVQGLASNICLLAGVSLEPLLDWSEIQIVLSMHDALMFECDEDKVDKWLPVIRKVMENPPTKEKLGFEVNIPLKVDIDVGKYWAED